MKDASRITIQRIFIYFALLSCFTFDSIARLELNGKSMSKVYMQMEDGISNSGNGGISKYLKDTSTDFMNDFIHGFTYLPGTFKHMLTIPFQKMNQIATGASLGFLGMSFFYDEQMDEFLRDHWEPQRRYFPMGEFPIPHLTLYKQENSPEYYDGVFITFAEYGYAFGLLTRKERFRHLCFNLLQSTAYSWLFTRVVKSLTGRARPSRNNKEHNPWEWGNVKFTLDAGGEYRSFPAFHAMYYFCNCTIIMDYIGYRWMGPIFGTFFYIQEANGHWFSDMVAGGILGYWLGAGILEKTRIEKKMASGLSVTVAPLYKGICLNVVKKL